MAEEPKEPYLAILLPLCLYGFLKELRPSEPFLTEYLIRENNLPQWSNVTLEEAYYDVYPVWTYSYLAVLVLVFLLTDFLRYKAVIVLEGFAYIATWLLLLFGRGVPTMQVMQVVYGIATSTEVAYYTYIYAKVPKERFQEVTSHTRVALLLGRFLSGVLAQTLTSFGLLDYKQLNIFSLCSVSLATVVSFFLPPVRKTIYFHKESSPSPDVNHVMLPLSEHSVEGDAQRSANQTLSGTVSHALKRVKKDFVSSFSNPSIMKWSLWWALGMCGNFQVGNYIQPLWETVAPMQHNLHLYNGAVEAATTLTGASLAFLLGYVYLNWTLIGEAVLFVLSVVQGSLLMAMARTEAIWVAYLGYLGFRAFYQMAITVSSYEIARSISADSYGLVFGFNTFMALAFQTILTMIVADDIGFAFPPRQQFFIYSLFCFGTGLLFLLIFGFSLGRIGLREYITNVKQELWKPPRKLTADTGTEAPLGPTDPQ